MLEIRKGSLEMRKGRLEIRKGRLEKWAVLIKIGINGVILGIKELN